MKTRGSIKKKWCVFLGPSLPRVEALRIAPGANVLPPARQGDVWRALKDRPDALVLIDGVFEAQPSVWHHELVDALESGVAVFGASSMGALRAAELDSLGMVGVGEVYQAYRRGVLVDDSEVALLHGDEAAGFRPFNVPLVNIRYLAEAALKKRVLSRQDARTLIQSALSIHYQDRDWGALHRLLRETWSPGTWSRFERWSRSGPLPDVKAKDAAECLRKVQNSTVMSPRAVRKHRASSVVRRQRLLDVDPLLPNGAAAEHAEGLTRWVLAELARGQGLSASPSELRARAESLGLGAGWAKALGLLPSEVESWLEDGQLAEQVLEHVAQLLPDAPSRLEATAIGRRQRLQTALGSPPPAPED